MGRNLANLELLVIVASIFHRYEFVLEDQTAEVRFSWRLCTSGCGESCADFGVDSLTRGKGSCASRLSARLA